MWAVVVGVMKVAESMVVVGTTLGVEVRIWAGMAAGDVVVVVRAKVKVLWVVAMATWAVVVVVIYLVVVVVVTAWTLAVVMIMTAVLIAMVTCQMSRAAVAAEQQCHC